MSSSAFKRRLVTVGMTFTVLAGVGLVYAAWLSGGSGTGYAKAGQAQDLSTVDVSANAGTLPNKLYPGTSGDVLVRIHNPNPYPVTVTDITGSGAISVSGGGAGCTGGTSGVSFSDQTGLSISVAASSDATTTLTNAAAMSSASHNDCQNATFGIAVDLVGQSG